MIEVMPFGWRGLYALGIAPVFLLPLLRRGIPETRRFSAQVGDALQRRGALH